MHYKLGNITYKINKIYSDEAVYLQQNKKHLGALNEDIISNFIQRIRHKNLEKKATPDESLRFFITLRNYYKLHATQPRNEEAINIYLAKLILLSSGLWLETIGTIEHETAQNKKEYTLKTFEHYSFEHNSNTAKAIVKLYNKKCLTQENAVALVKEISNKELLYLYHHSNKIDIDDYLNNKTGTQLKKMLEYIAEYPDSLQELFGQELLRSIMIKAQSKSNILGIFKSTYKKECTNGWFFLFRSKIAEKVYTGELTNQDIDERLSDHDKKSTTSIVYEKYNLIKLKA